MPINERFMPHGEVVSVNHEKMRGPSGSLAYMVDALFSRTRDDPITVAIYIEVDQANQSMTVTNELDASAQGKGVTHRIRCEGVEWVYIDAGSASADGAYRTWDTRVGLKQIEDGDIVVRRVERLVSGLVFKNRESYIAISKFKRVSKDNKK